MLLAFFFVLSALAGLAGLCALAPRSVPPISGTCALILTLAALGVAMYR